MLRSLALLALFAAVPVAAAEPAPGKAADAPGAVACDQCEAWNTPQKPFKIYGNTYYVGTHGLASILITSDQGHILIDGGLPQSAPLIAASIKALGFKIEDVKKILNSHAHFDHAGGLAELQRLSGGAIVMATFPSMAAMTTGEPQPDDPQVNTAARYPRVARVSPIGGNGAVISTDFRNMGPLKVTAVGTPGHTPGGTTWTWESCERSVCKHMVYADSLTPVSSPGFKFSADAARVLSFKHAIATVADLPCDILITPHPEASKLWERQAKKAFIDTKACAAYAATAGAALDKRLADENK